MEPQYNPPQLARPVNRIRMSTLANDNRQTSEKQYEKLPLPQSTYGVLTRRVHNVGVASDDGGEVGDSCGTRSYQHGLMLAGLMSA